MTLHADRELASAIERSVVRDLALYADKAVELDPELPAEKIALAGGVGVFLGSDSPVNMAYGLGMSAPVEASEIERLERWYAERGVRAAISLCPLAHPSLPDVLARRGWILSGFENVLGRELHDFVPPVPPRGVEVERVESPEDREVWAALSSRAFVAPELPSAAQARLSRVMSERRDQVLLVCDVGGTHAGTGALWVDSDLGWLLGDATLPAFRRKGIQAAIQIARMTMAREAGCRYVISEAIPGSASQRNQERLGLQVLYTRVELMSPVLA